MRFNYKILSHKVDWRQALLLAAAISGLLVASAQALFWTPTHLLIYQGQAAALVNGAVISQNQYRHQLELLEKAKASVLTKEERKAVLDHMIDNELLFQRADILGIARDHPNVRKAVLQEMIQLILDVPENRTPQSKKELKRFYQAHREWFAQQERLRVSRIYLHKDKGNKALRIAEAFRGGAAFDALAIQGDDVVINVPDHLLPIEALFQYLGEELTNEAKTMSIGEVKGPIFTKSGIHFLFLRDKRDKTIPSFDAILPEIERRYQIWHDQQMLNQYIQRLRRFADIDYPSAP